MMGEWKHGLINWASLKTRLLYALAGLAFLAIFFLNAPFPLIVAIAARVSHKGSPPATPQAFVAQPIDLPAGSRIGAMTAGPDRLVIDLLLADGTRQLLILDLATGQRLGTIPVRTAP